MSLNVNNFKAVERKDLGFPKLGAHLARLVAVIDLGIQERKPYKGEAKAPCRQINMIYELTDDFVTIDGEQRPRWISRNENAFNGPQANLPAVIRALDPDGAYNGDLAALAMAGAPCMVTIGPKVDMHGKPIDGVKITDIGAVPAALVPSVPPLGNPPIVFDFDNPSPEMYARLHNWVRSKIKEAKNYVGSSCEAMVKALDTQAAAAPQQAPVKAEAPAAKPAVVQPAPAAPLPPAPPAILVPAKVMTAKAAGATYDQFVAAGWTDTMLVDQGYMEVKGVPPVAAPPVAPVPPGLPY